MASCTPGGGAELSLACRIAVGEEDTFSMCMLKNGPLVTVHQSKMKIWSPREQTAPARTVSTPVAGDVSCVCHSPSSEHHFAASIGDSVLYYDERALAQPVFLCQLGGEEINEVNIHRNGNLICACDDSGDIRVIDIESAEVVKSLTGHHSNICSTAKFNPHQPWEILSGGLDCNIIRWDYSQGCQGCPLAKVSTQERTSQLGSYMINPPMVHRVAMAAQPASLVCGLGDGSVAVYDLSGGGLRFSANTAAHSSAVGHVSTASLKRGTDLIVSGGNDGRVSVSELLVTHGDKRELRRKKKTGRGKTISTRNGVGSLELKCLCSINHGSKVNWLLLDTGTGKQEETNPPAVYVADQSQHVSVYWLRNVC